MVLETLSDEETLFQHLIWALDVLAVVGAVLVAVFVKAVHSKLGVWVVVVRMPALQIVHMG